MKARRTQFDQCLVSPFFAVFQGGLPLRDTRLQIGLLPGLQQPLPGIVPFAQGLLRSLEACQHQRRQLVQLGISLGRIAHALDQQTHAMAVMARVIKGFFQGLPLFFQHLFDPLTQTAQQPFTLGRAQKTWKHIEDHQQLGQYLQPSRSHLPVQRFVHPDTFAWFAEEGYKMGFKNVASGPLVRSSYHADEQAKLVKASLVS